jgi:thiopeptide-type bacteriocin biosynthesis protein
VFFEQNFYTSRREYYTSEAFSYISILKPIFHTGIKYPWSGIINSRIPDDVDRFVILTPETKMMMRAQGFFMLRRPMLPLSVLYDFNRIQTQTPEIFRDRLLDFFRSPLMLEALLIASPSVYDALLDWDSHKNEKQKTQLCMTLYKYLIRMCSRSTPFGLFSGFCVGVVGEKTEIVFSKKKPVKRSSRLDMQVAAALTAQVSEQKALLLKAIFYVNSSLYRLAGQVRFLERTADNQLVLSSIAQNPLILAILDAARNGCTGQHLITLLLQYMPGQDALIYFAAIVDMQLVISEFELNLTGEPFFGRLIRKIKKIDRDFDQLGPLEHIRNLTRVRNKPLQSLLALRTVIEHTLPARSQSAFVQTDARFNMLKCTLGAGWIEKLLAEFSRLYPVFFNADAGADLGRFKAELIERYQGAEVSLAQALDLDTGIGYGKLHWMEGELPLLDSLRGHSIGKEPERQPDFSSFKQLIFDRFLSEKSSQIELTEKDLQHQELEFPNRPADFYWLGSILSGGQARLDNGQFQFHLKAIGGASGHDLLGRFTHADAQLYNYIQKAQRESRQNDPDVIFAEIVHMPSAGTANVLARKRFTEYEIDYLGTSGVKNQYRIAISDLTIGISADYRLVLKSNRLNKQIIPVMSTAHNYHNGLPVYRFLCELARGQNIGYRDWRWGHLNKKAFLPRITYKHFIVSAARWYLDKSNLGQPLDLSGFLRQWVLLGKLLKIPRYVLLSRADQELLIDTTNDFAMQVLYQQFKKEGHLLLKESFQTQGPGLLDSENHYYCHEVVLPFFSGSQRFPQMSFAEKTVRGKSFFPLSSQWLYVKIYCSPGFADHILKNVLNPYSTALIKQGKITKWFFVRYHDPAEHIRVRFYSMDKTDFWVKVITDIQAYLTGFVQNGLVSSIQTDIYKRETARYAGLPMEKIESIFHADSLAVIKILQFLDKRENCDQDRWLAALLGSDRILDDLGMDLAQKLRLVQNLHSNLIREFGLEKTDLFALNSQYRAHKGAIMTYFKRGSDSADFEPVYEIISLRSKSISAILQVGNAAGKLASEKVTASLLHLFLNRMFASLQRQQEFVSYHYLIKIYNYQIKMHKSAEADL